MSADELSAAGGTQDAFVADRNDYVTLTEVNGFSSCDGGMVSRHPLRAWWLIRRAKYSRAGGKFYNDGLNLYKNSTRGGGTSFGRNAAFFVTSAGCALRSSVFKLSLTTEPHREDTEDHGGMRSTFNSRTDLR